MNTIFALASASGKAGVSIIRISGEGSLAACAGMGARLGPHDRRLVKLYAADGMLIDQAFAISFAAGRSFTGEQVVELQTHGSPAVVSAVLHALGDQGLRPAEAGEFTRRALDNGELDLAQVEGLADLIDAETEGQRRQAVRVFSGVLGNLANGWREKLLRSAALLEATIDFVDEEVPVDVYPEVRDLVATVAEEVLHEASGVRLRERVRDGFEVALVGPPNSGKSTLLNRLAGREAAITSDIAGTTRDVLEVRMDLEGLPVTILDTAGLRESSDELEEIGIARGKARASMADIRVHLLESISDAGIKEREGYDIYLVSKIDTRVALRDERGISGATGQGIDDLLEAISSHLREKVAGAGVATRTRHEVALKAAGTSLETVLNSLGEDGAPVDLLAEDLRRAIRSLDSLIGRVDVESVLGEIFSSFCIGK